MMNSTIKHDDNNGYFTSKATLHLSSNCTNEKEEMPPRRRRRRAGPPPPAAPPPPLHVLPVLPDLVVGPLQVLLHRLVARPVPRRVRQLPRGAPHRPLGLAGLGVVARGLGAQHKVRRPQVAQHVRVHLRPGGPGGVRGVPPVAVLEVRGVVHPLLPQRVAVRAQLGLQPPGLRHHRRVGPRRAPVAHGLVRRGAVLRRRRAQRDVRGADLFHHPLVQPPPVLGHVARGVQHPVRRAVVHAVGAHLEVRPRELRLHGPVLAVHGHQVRAAGGGGPERVHALVGARRRRLVQRVV
mmetsp:Transcript_36599/g.53592  ORF Transcript_36599/g.53592 Transcript_36599/m.53592 type:complete len:294 (+) Transcript_36599:138-1019(+)